MESLRLRNYEVPESTVEYLKKYRFSFMRDISTVEDKYYIYSFPVYKVNGKEVMYCDLTVRLGDKHVDINVYCKDGSVYAAWYNRRYADGNRVVEQIDQSILGRLRNMKITQVEKKKEVEESNGSEHERRVPKMRKRNNRRNFKSNYKSEVQPEE